MIRTCILALGLISLAIPAIAGETLDPPKKEFSVTEHKIFNANTHSSRIMTHNGTIYFAYVNENLEGVVLKKTPDGTITESVVIPKHQEDTHNHISLGIDKNGYIHIAGDMHHAPLIGKRERNRDHLDVPWQYWISKKPEDISSFKFIGDTKKAPPNSRITYPFFFRDREGELYLLYRAGVIGKGYVYGVMGGCFAKYDTKKKRWNDVGGKTSYGMKALAWTEQGCPTSVTGYQSFKMTPFVDDQNRIHLTWTTFGKESPRIGGFGAQYVHYARTDDGGKTWKRADGSVIESLPLTEESGDVVRESVEGERRLASTSRVAITPEGDPVVMYRENAKPWWSLWQGKKKGWSEPQRRFDMYVVGDGSGTITWPRKDMIFRTSDGGATWQKFPQKELGANTFPHDLGYISQTGNLRLVMKTGTTLTVWTIPVTKAK